MIGMFYLIMVYMSTLNKQFGSAEMRDALIQSSIVAEGSVDSALREKSYNRGIRLYKIFYEALNRLIIVELDPGTNLQEDFEATITFPHSAENDILSILTQTQDCKQLSTNFEYARVQ